MQDELEITYLPLDGLIPYARNSRTHNDAQVAQIAASIREFGFTNPVLIDGEGGIIAGHGRVLAARKLALDVVPTILLDGLTETQRKAYVIADNKLALNAGWDDELLALELSELGEIGFDLELTGFTQDEIDALTPGEDDGEKERGEASGAGSLAARFMCPPFSVLNAREGWWQERKRAWLALGIDSELGRENGVDFGEGIGGEKSIKKGVSGHITSGSSPEIKARFDQVGTGASIFDPVLCELAYRWFSPEGGTVLDPFAGGSVRGIVASKLGRQYVGHELREE